MHTPLGQLAAAVREPNGCAVALEGIIAHVCGQNRVVTDFVNVCVGDQAQADQAQAWSAERGKEGRSGKPAGQEGPETDGR